MVVQQSGLLEVVLVLVGALATQHAATQNQHEPESDSTEDGDDDQFGIVRIHFDVNQFLHKLDFLYFESSQFAAADHCLQPGGKTLGVDEIIVVIGKSRVDVLNFLLKF
ncbi:hypothetical protein PFISCL1PPCAC_28051 [Pristionchus fissidentatus]|uniref:Secreted protein n=1 Tax=Pristionchus fissidentatus TaxID=1538716 RepID=A0AAV5WY08_9BILA|nr:hypothetical protein PFISCL1PPCAC_28051 [Pristionchus fissidentatus]